MADEIKNEVTEDVTPQPTLADLQAEINKLKEENGKLKTSVTNASADASKFKKQWQATLSEQERKDAEAAERASAMEAELAMYKTNERISGYKSKLMEVGYDATTADLMAKALPDGVGDNYFEAQRSFLANKEKSIKSEMLNAQPSVRSGDNPSQKAFDDAENAKLRAAFGL